MGLSKIRIAFLLILLMIFIVFKFFRTEKMIYHFSKQYEIGFNDERKAFGIYQFSPNWSKSYNKNDDSFEISYTDADSSTTFHYKKMIIVKSAIFFWKPNLQEEIDFFQYNVDSIKRIELTTIYFHHLKNGEDPWGLSYYSIIENGSRSINKQVNKIQIDSIINSWR